MEFKKSELLVNIYGVEYKLAKPTFAQARDLSRNIKSKGEEDSFDIICEHLASLGLSKEVVESMESEHVLALCEHLSAKKN